MRINCKTKLFQDNAYHDNRWHNVVTKLKFARNYINRQRVQRLRIVRGMEYRMLSHYLYVCKITEGLIDWTFDMNSRLWLN